MKASTIILIVLAVIIALSIIGWIFSFVFGAIWLALRVVFSPLGVIAMIVLVIYLLKNKK